MIIYSTLKHASKEMYVTILVSFAYTVLATGILWVDVMLYYILVMIQW